MRSQLQPLARDIAIVLGLKIVALSAIYWAFFSTRPHVDTAEHIAAAPKSISSSISR